MSIKGLPIVRMPPESFIKMNEGAPVKKHPRVIWDQRFQFVWVEYPQDNPAEKGKKFKIRFSYKDENRILRYKTVRFGDESDFIFHHDLERRISKFTHLTKQNDPFHPNYWRLHLLNTYPTIKQAYTKFIEEVIKSKQLTKDVKKVVNPTSTS